jgi:hypothetical protein
METSARFSLDGFLSERFIAIAAILHESSRNNTIAAFDTIASTAPTVALDRPGALGPMSSTDSKT